MNSVLRVPGGPNVLFIRTSILAVALLAAACSSDDESTTPTPDAGVAPDSSATDSSAPDSSAPDSSAGDAAATEDAGPDATTLDVAEPAALLAEYILPGDQAYPEGVTFDPTTRRFFTGSMALGNVTQTHADGTSEEFFAGNGGTDWIVLGLETDPERRRLWVCAAFSTALSESEIWVLDLDTGERLWQHSLESVQMGAACTDMIIADDGTAYLSDRENPNLYHADFEAKTAVLFATDPLLGSAVIGLNGMEFTPDRTALLTIRFAPGALIRISLDDPTDIAEVPLDGVTNVFGMDGLAVLGDHIYTVSDSQIIRATPAADWSTATAVSFPMDSGGYSGLTVAEGALYASKSSVLKFAFGQAPDLPFKLSRVHPNEIDK